MRHFLSSPEVKCDVGKQLEAVVLYVDLKANCLEVSLNTRLVEQVKHYADTKFTKVRRREQLTFKKIWLGLSLVKLI